nr:beta-ketoacyl synthase chain length factor [Luteibacter sp. Sphag1AF]
MIDSGQQPSCAFIPAMQRRRLSRLARITMDVAWPLCADDEQLPFVFASRHGETPRTFALLEDIGRDQPLSPTQFGLSVHNAIAGQWSILRGQKGESVALAGEGDTFEHAMLEAAALLHEGAPSALVVMAEEQPAEALRSWIDDVPFSYAVALRVSLPDASSSATRWRLSLHANDADARPGAWPNALDFLRALHDPHAPVQHAWRSRQWKWHRLP